MLPYSTVSAKILPQEIVLRNATGMSLNDVFSQINKVFPKYTDNILLIYVCMYVYVCMYMYDCMNILLKYILVGQVPTKRKQWFT